MANVETVLVAVKKTNPAYLVIAFLVVVIILQRMCQRQPNPAVDCIEFDTTAFISSLPIKYADTVRIYKPKPYSVYRDTGSTKIVKIPANVDTGAILLAYFTTNMYIDTILNDTNGLIVLTDVITENAIQTRQVNKKEIYPHYKIVTQTIKQPYQPRFQVYAGFGLGYWTDKFGASAKLLMKTKRDAVYGIGFDPINTYVEGSMYWKIKFKRQK